MKEEEEDHIQLKIVQRALRAILAGFHPKP